MTNQAHQFMSEIRAVPGILGMTFHSYGHAHTWLCQPCTFAIEFEGPPFPWVPQMSLLLRKNQQKNIQEPGEQEISTMAVFVCQPMLDSAR